MSISSVLSVHNYLYNMWLSIYQICWSDTLQFTSFREEITFPFSSSYGNPWSSNRYQWVVVVSRIAIIGIKRESGFYPEWGWMWSINAKHISFIVIWSHSKWSIKIQSIQCLISKCCRLLLCQLIWTKSNEPIIHISSFCFIVIAFLNIFVKSFIALVMIT